MLNLFNVPDFWYYAKTQRCTTGTERAERTQQRRGLHMPSGKTAALRPVSSTRHCKTEQKPLPAILWGAVTKSQRFNGSIQLALNLQVNAGVEKTTLPPKKNTKNSHFFETQQITSNLGRLDNLADLDGPFGDFWPNSKRGGLVWPKTNQ